MIQFWFIFLILTNTKSIASEKYTSFRLNAFPNQIYSPYLFSFEGTIEEEHILSSTYLLEQALPVEFISEIRKLEDFTSFKIELGFGNYALIYDKPIISADLPHAGTTYRVQTKSEETYKRFVKIMSGFFNTEIDRPRTSFLKLVDLDKQPYFYYNSGSTTLNFNNFLQISKFLNNQEIFSFLNLINPMKIFESDYISFVFELKMSKTGKITVDFSLNFIFREIVLNGLFNSLQTKISKFIEKSTYAEKNLKHEGHIKGDTFLYFIKQSPSILNLQTDNNNNDILQVRLSAQNTTPVHFLRHRILFEIENLSETNTVDFQLNVIFKSSEYPLLQDLEFLTISGTCEIFEQKLVKWEEEFDTLDGHLIVWKGRFSAKSKLKIAIPFQQIHKNFEFVESDHLIANLSPASFFEFRKEGSKDASKFKSFKNTAYKTKNYDTTIVFAVISVYLLIFFLTFNSITKITEN